MDYEKLLARDWNEIEEIGNQLIKVSQIMSEQKELKNSNKKIDKELITEQFVEFKNAVSNLIDIKSELPQF